MISLTSLVPSPAYICLAGKRGVVAVGWSLSPQGLLRAQRAPNRAVARLFREYLTSWILYWLLDVELPLYYLHILGHKFLGMELPQQAY